jgi:hypothetical protein
MTEQALIKLNFGPRGDDVQGFLEIGDEELADFHFTLGEANYLAGVLRDAAGAWAEAHQQGNVTKFSRWTELHEAAARCFECVFGDAVERVEECLADAPPGAELWVRQQHSSLSMPWGLLCTRSDARFAGELPLQILLWSAKYNLRTTLQHGRASRQRTDPWGFEAVVCKETYSADLKQLRPEAVPLAETILERSLDPHDLQRASEAPTNCFVYVHTHSASELGDLVFRRSEGSSDYKCQPIEIVKRIVPMSSGAAVLAVLNACDSARGFKSMGPSLVMQGCTIELACIATEFPAEREFATEFALELIDRCVQQGESTYTAMNVLRRKHYPLSIIYSHYCKADLTTGKPLPVFEGCDMDAYRTSIEYANYSYRQGAAPQ